MASKADLTRELRKAWDKAKVNYWPSDHRLTDDQRFISVAHYFLRHFDFSSANRRVLLRDVKRRSFRTDRCEICEEPAYWFLFKGMLMVFRCYHGDRKRHPSKGGGHVYWSPWRCLWPILDDDKLRDMLLMFGIDPVELEDGSD